MWLTVGIVVGVIVAALLAFVLVPVRVHVSMHGHGELGKTWVIAGGVKVLVLTVSVAMASGVDDILQLHVFGIRVLRRSPIVVRSDDSSTEPKHSILTWMIEDLPRNYKKFTSRLRVDETAKAAWKLLGYVRLRKLEGQLTYCTPDVALTGMIAGALYTITGLLAPWGVFGVTPLWEDVAKADGKMSVQVWVYPGRMVVSVLWYLLTHWRWQSDDVLDQGELIKGS